MSEVHAARRERLRDRCAAAGAAAALVSRPANVRYLTGCAPADAVLLVGPGPSDTLLHRRRPTGEAAEGQSPDLRTLSENGDGFLAEIDIVHKSVHRHATWKEWLAAHPGLKKPH